MKNNYNPYTVPDSFFETVCNNAVSKARKRRNAIICGFAAMVIAAVVIVTPVFTHISNNNDVLDNELKTNTLANMYEYDIFLQVNFE